MSPETNLHERLLKVEAKLASEFEPKSDPNLDDRITAVEEHLGMRNTVDNLSDRMLTIEKSLGIFDDDSGVSGNRMERPQTTAAKKTVEERVATPDDVHVPVKKVDEPFKDEDVHSLEEVMVGDREIEDENEP